MHTLESLKTDIRTMGLKGTETLLVHSSIKSIGSVDGGGETVIDAFMEYFSGGLLVFPTFTSSRVNTANPVFNVAETPSEVGILTNLFRVRPGVVRSLHPSHSLAAWGEGAAELCAGAENYDTIYNPETSWGRLLERGVKILMLGVELNRCTFIHAIEEWAGVPVLSQRPVTRYTMLDNGRKLKVPLRWHTNAHWRNYPIAQDFLEDCGALKKCTFGDAACLLVDGPSANEHLGRLLKEKPRYFGKPNRYLR